MTCPKWIGPFAYGSAEVTRYRGMTRAGSLPPSAAAANNAVNQTAEHREKERGTVRRRARSYRDPCLETLAPPFVHSSRDPRIRRAGRQDASVSRRVLCQDSPESSHPFHAS